MTSVSFWFKITKNAVTGFTSLLITDILCSDKSLIVRGDILIRVTRRNWKIVIQKLHAVNMFIESKFSPWCLGKMMCRGYKLSLCGYTIYYLDIGQWKAVGREQTNQPMQMHLRPLIKETEWVVVCYVCYQFLHPGPLRCNRKLW